MNSFNDSGAVVAAQPPGRKLSKRPTETPGLESSRNFSPTPAYNPYDDPQPQHYNNVPSYDNYQQNQPYAPSNFGGYPPGGVPNVGYNMPAGPGAPGLSVPTQLFSDPLVANVAMTYGSKIMDSGKELVDREIEKYVPVTRLKYYFAVDTSYVLHKLKLLFFPFTHNDWSVKYEHNEPVQPRYEVNAPDLYIPTMAYVTYVLVAGMALGTQNRFAPEVLGMLASSALAWTVVEIVVALVTLYITNTQTKLKTFDLIAYAGYKYVG
ncbi:Protein yif1b [Homalodisca vitripennis]|nr:Protein yif1b [Homalodisca vitripennis]